MRRKLTLTAILASIIIAGQTAQAEQVKLNGYQQAKKIIYATFPKSTENSALRIAGCETGHTYSQWATGKAGEKGYFQIHPSNNRRSLYWKGNFVGRIMFSRLYNPWYNSKVALYMSEGGKDWHEWWICSGKLGLRR